MASRCRSLNYVPLVAFVSIRLLASTFSALRLPCMAFDRIRLVSFRSVSFRFFSVKICPVWTSLDMTITQQLSEINPNKSSFFLSRPGETLLPRSSPLLFRPYLQHSTLPDKTMPPGLARPNEKTGADKSKIREKGGEMNKRNETKRKKKCRHCGSKQRCDGARALSSYRLSPLIGHEEKAFL